MKKILLGIVIGIGFISLIAFKANYEVKKSIAEVNQLQGLYIFTDSKPVSEYDYLGTVSSSASLGSPQYEPVRDRLLKKIKKEYPNADGVILHLVNEGTDKADAIKFK